MITNTNQQLLRYIRYALPTSAVACLLAPMAIVQGVYAKHYGLSLEGLALVFLCSRVFDAITDPLTGYLSDRYYQRTGTRKPFMLVGGVLFVVSAYFLYVPPDTPSLLYFFIWFMAFYLAWTLFEIPHVVWAGELCPESNEKVKIFSVRTAVSYCGLILFYVIPLLPMMASRDITPETLKIVFWIAGPLMLLFLMVSLRLETDSTIPIAENTQEEKTKTFWQSVVEFGVHFKSVFKNKMFLQFLLGFALFSLSTGLWYSLIFLYVDVYLGMGEAFAQIFLIAFIVGLLMTPVWAWVAIRVGKKIGITIVSMICVFSFVYTGLLQPGSTSLTELVFLKTIQTIGFVGFGPICLAMMSEIIDYDALKQGIDRSGTYYSAYTFLLKNVGAVATASGLAMVGAFGFDATAQIQTPGAVAGLILTISWIPTALCLIAIPCILMIPMNERKHAIIRRRMDRCSNRFKYRENVTA